MSDLRATLRQLRQSPAHLAACLLSLSAGMAICVAVFSAFNAMVFEPIPGVRDRRQLVQLRWGDGSVTFSPAEACVALLFLTGLAVRSLQAAARLIPAGAAGTLVADIDLSTLPQGQPGPGDFVDAVDDTLRSQTAVSSAGIADFFGIGGGVTYWMPSDGLDAARAARGGFVTGGWFESMGVRLPRRPALRLT